jgi:hypothetical protein
MSIAWCVLAFMLGFVFMMLFDALWIWIEIVTDEHLLSS